MAAAFVTAATPSSAAGQVKVGRLEATIVADLTGGEARQGPIIPCKLASAIHRVPVKPL